MLFLQVIHEKKTSLLKSEDAPVLSSWLLVIITIWSDTVKHFQDCRRYRNGTVYQNLEIYLFVKIHIVEPGEKYGNSVRRKSEANPFSCNIICTRVLSNHQSPHTLMFSYFETTKAEGQNFVWRSIQ